MPVIGIFTFLDTAFVICFNLFPLDHLFILLLTMYMAASTLNMIRGYGVGFFGVSIYKFGRRNTIPQALILGAALVVITVPAWILLLRVAAPQYTAFGSQSFCNYVNPTTFVRDCSQMPSQIFSCQFSSPIGICTPTVISTIVDRYLYVQPVFGVLFHTMLWIFCIIVIVGIFFAVSSGNKSKMGPEADDDEETSFLVTNAQTAANS
eukprot:jgi/Hompol1/3463/HPOL_005230-RA